MNQRKKYTRENRRMTQRERQKQLAMRMAVVGGGVFVLVLCFVLYINIFGSTEEPVLATQEEMMVDEDANNPIPRPDIDVQLLTINEFSRPGIATDQINGIVIHYLANPGSTAQENRDYFESLKDGPDYISSNFVIGLEGEIVQCVPTTEVAYASNSRNNDTISIENCHPDETGEFNEATYDSVVKLTAYLCGKYQLSTNQIIRHYDVTGKICPKYFVEHEDAWEQFKTDVANYMDQYTK